MSSTGGASSRLLAGLLAAALLALAALLLLGLGRAPAATDAAPFPTRQTRFGAVRGFYGEPLRASADRAEVYLGLPFAEPPLGALRFEKPKPWVRPYEGVLNATQFPMSCYPLRPVPGQAMAEDCLRLNVMTPPRPAAHAAGHPVLVYVHGGGFAWGMSAIYGHKNLSLNFVAHDIVVVVIQYRLGAYGFATDGTSDLPGNLGLFDQAEAFRWISENIAAFGGDPERVTAWGLSAGGTSVGHLEQSPYSSRYIQSTIIQSGVPSTTWGLQEQSKVREVTEQLAAELKCGADGWKACFKQTDPEAMLAATGKVNNGRSDLNFLGFAPVKDGDFFPGSLRENLEATAKSSTKPSLVGNSMLETILFSVVDIPFSFIHNHVFVPKERRAGYNKTDFTNYVRQYITSEERLGGQSAEFTEKVADFYGNMKPEETVKVEPGDLWLWRHVELTSDIMFSRATSQYADLRTEVGWPTYMYRTEYCNTAQFPAGTLVKAATHTSEYPYMNGFFVISPFEFDEDDLSHQRAWVGMIVNMVKEGKPDQSGAWPPITPQNHTYGRVRSSLEVGAHLNREKLAFWDDLGRRHGKDVLTMEDMT